MFVQHEETKPQSFPRLFEPGEPSIFITSVKMNVLRRVSLTWQQKASIPPPVQEGDDQSDRARSAKGPDQADAPQSRSNDVSEAEPAPTRPHVPTVKQTEPKSLEEQFMALAHRKYAGLPDLVGISQVDISDLPQAKRI